MLALEQLPVMVDSAELRHVDGNGIVSPFSNKYLDTTEPISAEASTKSATCCRAELFLDSSSLIFRSFCEHDGKKDAIIALLIR